MKKTKLHDELPEELEDDALERRMVFAAGRRVL